VTGAIVGAGAAVTLLAAAVWLRWGAAAAFRIERPATLET